MAAPLNTRAVRLPDQLPPGTSRPHQAKKKAGDMAPAPGIQPWLPSGQAIDPSLHDLGAAAEFLVRALGAGQHNDLSP